MCLWWQWEVDSLPVGTPVQTKVFKYGSGTYLRTTSKRCPLNPRNCPTEKSKDYDSGPILRIWSSVIPSRSSVTPILGLLDPVAHCHPQNGYLAYIKSWSIGLAFDWSQSQSSTCFCLSRDHAPYLWLHFWGMATVCPFKGSNWHTEKPQAVHAAIMNYVSVWAGDT